MPLILIIVLFIAWLMWPKPPAFRHPARGDLTFAVLRHKDGTEYGVAYVGNPKMLGRPTYCPRDPTDPASPIVKRSSVDLRESAPGSLEWLDRMDPGKTIGHFDAMGRFPKLIEAVEDDGFALTD